MTITIIHRKRIAQRYPKQQRGKKEALAETFLSNQLYSSREPHGWGPQQLLKQTYIIFILLVIMVDLSAALVSSSQSTSTRIHEFRPSSASSFIFIRSPSSYQQQSKSPSKRAGLRSPSLLVPSQVSRFGSTVRTQVSGVVMRAHVHDSSETTENNKIVSDDDAEPKNSLASSLVSGNPNQRRKRRRKKTALNSTSSTPRTTKSKTPPRRSGNLPDIYWRSIPMEDLRHHPQFQALPPPESISKLEKLDDIRFFRQESWQWDAVHEGRCTTSQAAAALGFLEPKAAKLLGVPRSWQRGGIGAYYRLRKPALQTLEEMNSVLCGEYRGESEFQEPPKDPTVWAASSGNLAIAAKYTVRTTPKDIKERKDLIKKLTHSPGFDSSVRMMWGNAQESTALLTALNFFWRQDNGVVLKEVGMCGGGLPTNVTNDETGNLLLVGATPDGLLCYPDGTVEALEVKNHCPFFSVLGSGQSRSRHRHTTSDRFMIRHFDFVGCGVPPQYIPQLMMEMFCIGENCRSAVMVRQTATSGALILRLRRDDEWIDEMMYWLRRFKEDFVDREELPPTNFFYEGISAEDVERYTTFLERTKALQETVEVVAQIPHVEIQRATGVQPGMTNLFLD